MIQKTTINECKLIELSKICSRSGNITLIENYSTIPFKVKRIYYLYDVPGGSERGGHAHKNLFQLLVAASGSFDVILGDGISKIKINLNQPDKGILIVPGIWRELNNFSSGSICLVLASEFFSEVDYIRSYYDFIHWKEL